MKKVLFTFLALLLISCNTGQMKYGQGGRNACQFVKEQVPGMREDIQSVEVVKEDSLMGDIGITFAKTTLAKSCVDFMEGRLSKEKFTKVIDSLSNVGTDIYYSWKYSTVVNDSLKFLPKYTHLWRKVYTIRVTMKSGITKEPRVLMDQDGTTPRMIEKDMEKDIEEFTKKILEAQEMTWF